MATEKYEVLEPSYLNDAVREVGEIVELDIKYDAKRDTNIKPVGERKKTKAKDETAPAEPEADPAPTDANLA